MSENKKKKSVLRESPLTELCKTNEDIHSAYNLCFAIFMIWFANTLFNYIIDTKEFYDDMIWLKWCFTGNHFTILCLYWLIMQFTAFLILYPVLKLWLWSKTRTSLNTRTHNLMLTLFSICYQLLLFWLGLDFSINQYLSPVSTFIIMMEQVRLSMKSISFIEENRNRLNVDCKDNASLTSPTFKQFLYFLFAPTLIYRDTYIRTNKIEWILAVKYFTQFLATLVILFTISWKYIEYNYKWTGVKPFQVKQLGYLFFSGCLIGLVIEFVYMYYCMHHCWYNTFAHLLRFGDRRFCGEWWNVKECATYYRLKNIIVHEWLKTYIFDNWFNLTKNRGQSALIVFVVSAAVHEYILSLSFGFFLPVLFSTYVVIGGSSFFIVRSNVKKNLGKVDHDNTKENYLKEYNRAFSLGKVIFYIALGSGWSLFIMLYSMEWYSRVNCPTNDTSISNYFWPQFISCVTIE